MLLVSKLSNSTGNNFFRYLKQSVVSQQRQVNSSPTVCAISEETKKALKNFSDIKHAPTPALFYGVAGLIPFTAIPSYMIHTGVYVPEMAFTSMAYSAVILSFIGGVRWGSAVSSPEIMKPNWKNFSSSIAPSVVAWMSLLVSNPIGSCLAISGFALSFIQDISSTQFPSWYRSLRILLSSIAICALLTTLMCQYLLPWEEKKQ